MEVVGDTTVIVEEAAIEEAGQREVDSWIVEIAHLAAMPSVSIVKALVTSLRTAPNVREVTKSARDNSFRGGSSRGYDRGDRGDRGDRDRDRDRPRRRSSSGSSGGDRRRREPRTDY